MLGKLCGIFIAFLAGVIVACALFFTAYTPKTSYQELGPYQRYLIVDDSVVQRLSEVTGLDIDAHGNLVDREHPSGFTAEKEKAVMEDYLSASATATAVVE
ncbi:MAG: hypothetical protein IJI14_07920 [Anaerolineaceae bacterium]|nr:hypothetical protein [Anaerolineaceae bacterium]